MPVSKSVSRTLSKDSDSLNFRSTRTGSLRSEGSSTRSQSSTTRLRQRLITSSFLRQDEYSKSPRTSPGSVKRAVRHQRETRATQTPRRTLRQLTLFKANSTDSVRRTPSRRSSSSIQFDDSDFEYTPPRRRARSFKRSRSSSTTKSSPSKLTPKRLNSYKRIKPDNKDAEISQQDSISTNQDEYVEGESEIKITNLSEVPKNFPLTSSVDKESTVSIDTSYSLITIQDEDDDDLNEGFRFNRTKRPNNLQESILGLISKYKLELESLDEKIKILESQFFSNPPETTGLIKGWEGNLFHNGYSNFSGHKSRRGPNSKLKNHFTQTQNLITEHIFSLTSSTCANEGSVENNKCNNGKSFINKLRSKNDKFPISYLEFRESEYKIAKERKEVLKSIGASIRDKQAPKLFARQCRRGLRKVKVQQYPRTLSRVKQRAPNHVTKHINKWKCKSTAFIQFSLFLD
eukprot:XP_763607.1 hypothetical protein [Theileria parva strain Muguga]